MPTQLPGNRSGTGFAHQQTEPPRDWYRALRSGFALRCPACDRGAMFGQYLKVTPVCRTCGTELHHHRADDAPPYVTMMITGHLLVAGLLALEKAAKPPIWVHLSVWVPLTILLSFWLLPRVKGALIGIQWANRMHGFGDRAADANQLGDGTRPPHVPPRGPVG